VKNIQLSSGIHFHRQKVGKQRSLKSWRWPILTLLLLATGCSAGRESLLKEITEFNQSVQTGTEAIAAYYENLNEQETQLYIMAITLEPNCEIGDQVNYDCLDPKWDPNSEENRNSEGWIDSPLKQPLIPIESIQTRLDILKELSEYSKSLAALAGDESAEKFQGNVITLTERLTSLEKKLIELEKNARVQPNNASNLSLQPDLTISERYLTPIGKIIAILGKMATEEAQWQKIRQAILDAEQPINTILTEIASDLDAYVYPLNITGTAQRYRFLMVYYNDRRNQVKPAERTALLQEILVSKKAYNDAVAIKPSKSIKTLQETHTRLVALAKSGGNPKDLAEVKAWLERFKADVEQLATAVKQLVRSQGGQEP
jgi:predicted DNA-binding protein